MSSLSNGGVVKNTASSHAWGEVNLLLNVTFNNISVIYVTAPRCAGGLKKKLDLRLGSQRNRHFVRFFNMHVQAPTRGHPFYTVISRNRPIKSPFTTGWGYGGHILDLNPGSKRRTSGQESFNFASDSEQGRGSSPVGNTDSTGFRCLPFICPLCSMFIGSNWKSQEYQNVTMATCI